MLDEPSLGLSPRLTSEVFALIGELNRSRGIAILLVEQNTHKALELASRAYVLELGRKVMEGTPAQLRARSWWKGPDVFVLVDDYDLVATSAGNPLLARSIQNRFAYLDPLNHLQVELIDRRRKLGDNEDPRVHRGIHLSINGVAAGLRNTG